MLFSFSLILLGGMLLGTLFKKIKFPPLFGYMLIGILLGPYCLNWIDSSILNVSSELRRFALIIILIRAGLNLDVDALKKVGRPAILMCFLPATFEIIGFSILGPMIFHLSLLDSLILGSVLAAVSPAVVVPNMLKLIDERYGTDEGIPQLIMAGASVDDVFVIVLFTSFTTLASSGSFDAWNFLRIPTSIISGIGCGLLIGLLLNKLFERIEVRNVVKVILLLCISFMLMKIEDSCTGYFGYSGLLSIMSMTTMIHLQKEELSNELSSIYSSLWVFGEVVLFALVGAAVDIQYASMSFIPSILIIFGALIFRMIGVYLCVLGTKLNKKERIFCMIAYTPKATVQAAIGSIPLSLGLSCGNTVLTVAVCAILITAPLGAFFINLLYPKLLKKSKK
jgi:solute carrier family 9B (sodium/hydrogen exchanger), member 1/2